MATARERARPLRWRATAFVAAALLVPAARAEPPARFPDPERPLVQLGLDSWTTDQGLPNATVNSILLSRQGYVWLATYDGLARFDGTRFVVFGKGDGLAGNGVRALCEGVDGSVWAGTNGGGVSRYHRGRFEHLGRAEGLPSEMVWSLLADRRDGTIWIGTNGGGLARLSDERIERFPRELSGATITALAQGEDGAIWIGAGADGLRRLGPDGRFTAVGREAGVPPIPVISLGTGHGDTIWAGTTAGLLRLVGGRAAPLPAALEPLRQSAISAILEDPAGSLWIGTNGRGLARLASGALSFLDRHDGVGDVVHALGLDEGGNVWVGTNGWGVSRLRDGSFSTYTTRDGLAHDFAYSVFQDRSGTIWAGTVGGLDRLEGGRFVTANPPTKGPVMVRSITEGNDGALWIGTYREGVWRLSGGTWRGFGVREGLPNDSVRAVMADRSGRVWAATIAGLGCFEDGRWTAYGVSQGLPIASTIGLAEDREGAIWVGTDGGGLARLRNGAFEVFTSSQGLASDVVLSLFTSARGDLWVGTNGGLSRWRGDRFVSYSRKEGLPSESVAQLGEDLDGNLWVGTGRGVARLGRASVESETAVTRLDVETFDRSDGMLSSQCTAAGQAAGRRLGDGRLWFATTRGLAAVDPGKLRVDTTPPELVVEGVLLNGQRMRFEDGVDVPPGPARLDVSFAALSPLGPSQVSVRFRLEGFDRDWVEAGDGRNAVYTSLPPGRYLFRLSGRTRNGPWSSREAAVAVRVAPRFYERPAFVALLALAAAAAVFAGHRFRVRRLEERQRELAGLVEERTRSLAWSESRFRQLAEAIDAAFFVRSLEPPQLLYMSPAFERIWGRPVPGDPRAFLETIHPDDRQAFVAAVERQREGYDLEYRIVRPDGSIRWIRSRTFPVADAVGRVERVAGLAEDVTAKKSVEQLREDLTYTIVHDLRSPLTSMYSSMKMLETSLAGGSPTERELVRIARNGALKLLAMVNAILDVGRLEQGAVPLDPEPVDLAALAAEVLAQVRPLAAARGLELSCDLPPDLPLVHVDRGLLFRVLENLAGNAIKVSPGAGRVAVTARLEDGSPGFVTVEVRDDGPGISPEVRGRLFEKFAAGKERTRGHGLGLHFCRLAVEAHGGRIAGENREGRGATFRFTVPREPAGSASG